jgi:phosphoribosylaminoimidazole (AIR) synthetase
MAQERTPDLKGQASLGFADVISLTRNNYPDEIFRPVPVIDTPYYRHQEFHIPPPYGSYINSDGTGGKPGVTERLRTHQHLLRGLIEDGDIDTSTHIDDYTAMVLDDGTRFGKFPLGFTLIIDVNRADPEMMTAFAQRAKLVCDREHIALVNGEVAELRGRLSGYGPNRLNINGDAYTATVPDKRIYGEQLAPGQLLVAMREPSIRSNGLTRYNDVLEICFLRDEGHKYKDIYFMDRLQKEMEEQGIVFKHALSTDRTLAFLDTEMGHNFLEQVFLPWHLKYTDIAREVRQPSTIYMRAMYQALGGPRGEKQVDITGAAHISGGGIPEKVGRMVQPKGLGAHIEAVFPDPKSITMLMELARNTLTEEEVGTLISEKIACEEWNRGIGYIVAVRTQADADRYIQIAQSEGFEAAVAGEITDKPEVEFHGYTWPY